MTDRSAAEREFDAASEALDDVDRMSTDEFSRTVILDRLYYACFHAARAILYTRGFEPHSHDGLRRSSGNISYATAR